MDVVELQANIRPGRFLYFTLISMFVVRWSLDSLQVWRTHVVLSAICFYIDYMNLLQCSIFSLLATLLVLIANSITDVQSLMISVFGAFVCLFVSERLEVTPCCPFAGCPLKASCTGSSRRKVTCGASASSCGRFSPTENNPGSSWPITRLADVHKCYSHYMMFNIPLLLNLDMTKQLFKVVEWCWGVDFHWIN